MKIKNAIRNYFHRIFSSVSKVELAYWWILRGLMIFALIDTICGGKFLHMIGINADYKGSNPPIQIIANLVGMFAYEIIQFFPEKSSGFFSMMPKSSISSPRALWKSSILSRQPGSSGRYTMPVRNPTSRPNAGTSAYDAETA